MSEEDDGIQTLATQGGVTLFGSIIGKALGFLFVAVATRLVSPEEYGIFTLALSIVLFIQGFSSLSVSRSLDYFLPQHLDDGEYDRAKTTVQNVTIIGLTSSLIGAGVVFFARGTLQSVFSEPRLYAVLGVFVLLIPLQTILQTLLAVFNGIKKLKYRAIIRDLVNPTFRIVGAVGLILGGFGLFGLVGAYMLGVTLAIVIGLLFLIYEADWIRSSSRATIANRAIMAYSLPLVLAGVIYSLVGQIDFFMIGFFRGPTEVGQYRVAYLLAANLLIILSSITPIFKPLIAENKSKTALIGSQYRTATRWVTMLTLPLSIPLLVAPETYLGLLFTEQYAVASGAVITLTIGYLLNASFGPEGMMLEGLGHTRLTLLNTIVLVGTNGVLDVLLVPRYGIVGAGLATSSALTLTSAIGVLEIHYLRGISPVTEALVRVWVAALPALGAGWYLASLDSSTIVTAVSVPFAVILIYLLGLRVFGGFLEEDARIARQVDSKIGYPILKTIVGFN
jgi:O-antigen/teichoic acid export membrane protein